MPIIAPIAHQIKDDFNVSSLQKLRWKLFGYRSLWDLLPFTWGRFYYDHVKTIFAPCHSRIRKSIPRRWSDLTEVIVSVNFEIIKSFYEDEMMHGHVNWDASPPHRKFKKWIEKVYIYITKERPQLLIDLDKAYPELTTSLICRDINYNEKGERVTQIKTDNKTYEELYGEVDRIEKLIDKNDSQYIIEMIKFRKYFWT
jgi:hypothetical protein